MRQHTSTHCTVSVFSVCICAFAFCVYIWTLRMCFFPVRTRVFKRVNVFGRQRNGDWMRWRLHALGLGVAAWCVSCVCRDATRKLPSFFLFCPPTFCVWVLCVGLKLCESKRVSCVIRRLKASFCTCGFAHLDTTHTTRTHHTYETHTKHTHTLKARGWRLRQVRALKSRTH